METNWRSRSRGPVREVVFEEEVEGVLTEILECGHTKPVPIPMTQENYWGVDHRICPKCLIELKSGERKTDKIDKPWSLEDDNVIHLDDYR